MTEPEPEETEERFKVFPVDPDVASFCHEVAHTIAADLGESPEAWRGAAVMGCFIKCSVSAEAAAIIAAGEPVEPSSLGLHLLLTTAMLEKFPTWPKEDGGEPLIQEGDPSTNRPYFKETTT